ncbi:GNAT family N-acetyltransferase [Clostridium acidisoli]|nr:GNAT family N-acetyltransferase [Clostridium acidisoli]
MSDSNRMKYSINGNEYNFIKDVKENQQKRKSFNLLAQDTFGINFEPWYQNGYWGGDYIPYALLNVDKVVSNVSVNIINTRWREQTKRYIQLGTVMTAKEYRGKGLSRWLIEKVLEDWKDKCDAIYLFANDSALNFYPKFDFEKALEYQYQKKVNKKCGRVKKLDMSVAHDRKLLLDTYKFSNPFSALPMENNEGLLMFYCSQFMKENIYYIEQYKAVVVAEYDDENLVCYDIFCQGKCTIYDILCTMARQNTKIATIGFTPKLIKDFKITEVQKSDTTLFMLKEKENLFKENKLMFPLLSHA